MTAALCGFCEVAARTSEPRAHHRHCRIPQCACGAADHKFNREMADVMARCTGLPVEQVYARHERSLRVMTAAEKAAAAERLRAYRESIRKFPAERGAAS